MPRRPLSTGTTSGEEARPAWWSDAPGIPSHPRHLLHVTHPAALIGAFCGGFQVRGGGFDKDRNALAPGEQLLLLLVVPMLIELWFCQASEAADLFLCEVEADVVRVFGCVNSSPGFDSSV